MHKNILVPIDIANINKASLSIDIAVNNVSSDGNIILLNVIEDIPKWAAAQLPHGTLEKSEREATKKLKAVAKKYPDAPIDIKIRMGHTYQKILDLAEEHNVDLIVIASHRPGFRDYYLGSTAAKVVRHAKCSVHVVR